LEVTNHNLLEDPVRHCVLAELVDISEEMVATEALRADEELLVTRLPPPRLAWRRDELVADEHRVQLGRSLTDVVHASD